MRGVYFYGFTSALALGTALALLGRVTVGGSALILIICVGGCAFTLLARSFKETGVVLGLLLVTLAGFGVGALRASFVLDAAPDDIKTNETVVVEGKIIREPVLTEKNQKIVIAPESGEKGRMIMFVSVHPHFSYGDIVRVEGVLKKPESFAIEGTGRTFNYPRYLAKEGIFSVIDKPKIELVESGKGNVVMEGFISIRRMFIEALQRSLSEPYAGFASGVVLGVDGALSKHDEELFRNAGLIHVVVVSGYNITLVGDFIGKALAFLPSVFASLGSLIGILAFILLTGGSQTAIRAGIMAALVVASRLTKRHYDMNRALLFAGSLMIVHQPLILLYDPSFQLSFLATWGLCNLTSLTIRCMKKVPERFGLRDIAATTLATQLAVTPLLLHMSGVVSVFSLPANIAVLPIMPLLMIGTLAIGVLGFMPALLLTPISLIVEMISAYAFGVVYLINGIRYSTVSIPAHSFVLLALLYGGLLLLVWREKRKAPRPILEGGRSGALLRTSS